MKNFLLYFVLSLLILCFPSTEILVCAFAEGVSELSVSNQLATSFSHAQQILPSLNPVF